MSTRSVTIVDSEFKERDWKTGELEDSVLHIARFYRHCDGYPEGHGAQVALALGVAEISGECNNRNWAQHFFANLCSMDMDIEFEPVSKAEGGYTHGDLEYLYRIIGKQDYTGGKEYVCQPVEVEVFSVTHTSVLGDDYSNVLSGEPIFKGGWREMMSWIEGMCGEELFSGEWRPASWISDSLTEWQWEKMKEARRG